MIARDDGTESLADLPPGAVGEVAAVEATGPLGRRLLDLGFSPPTRVRVVRKAPLGDPLVYEHPGTQLCLRRTEACRIRVRRS